MESILLFNNQQNPALSSSTISIFLVLFYWPWLTQTINLFMLTLGQLVEQEMLVFLLTLFLQHVAYTII